MVFGKNFEECSFANWLITKFSVQRFLTLTLLMLGFPYPYSCWRQAKMLHSGQRGLIPFYIWFPFFVCPFNWIIIPPFKFQVVNNNTVHNHSHHHHSLKITSLINSLVLFFDICISRHAWHKFSNLLCSDYSKMHLQINFLWTMDI